MNDDVNDELRRERFRKSVWWQRKSDTGSDAQERLRDLNRAIERRERETDHEDSRERRS